MYYVLWNRTVVKIKLPPLLIRVTLFPYMYIILYDNNKILPPKNLNFTVDQFLA